MTRHLYFDADGLTRLRAKYRADIEVEPQRTDIPGVKGSFGYLLTRDADCLARARESLRPLLAEERWNTPIHSPDGRWFDLISAGTLLQFTHYLDWCGEGIEPAERAHIILALENHGARAVIRDHEMSIGWYDESGPVNNWVAVLNGSMGLAAILLWDERHLFREALRVCVHHMRRYLDWINDDGSIEEVAGYWHYGMVHLLSFLEALRVNRDNLPPEIQATGAADWLHENPKLLRSAHFTIAGMLDDQFRMTFGDCQPTPMSSFAAPFMLLARTFGDAHLQWHCDQLRRTKPLSYIWHDSTLTATPPEATPSEHIFDTDWLLIHENAPEPGGFFFAMRGGSNAQTHCHLDLGTIILWYAAEPLLCDRGKPGPYPDGYFNDIDAFYFASTRGHSCVLVDGRGQVVGADTHGAIRRCPPPSDHETQYEILIVSPGNGIITHRRTVTVSLRDKSIHLCDEVETAAASAVEFRFQHQGEITFSGAGEHSAATITRPGARLEMTFAGDSALSVRDVEEEGLAALRIAPANKSQRHRLETSMQCVRADNLG